MARYRHHVRAWQIFRPVALDLNLLVIGVCVRDGDVLIRRDFLKRGGLARLARRNENRENTAGQDEVRACRADVPAIDPYPRLSQIFEVIRKDFDRLCISRRRKRAKRSLAS